MATVSKDTVAEIAKAIDKTTADPVHDLPGVVFVAVNRNGEKIVEYASGLRKVGSDQPMTIDTTFWWASFTKVITGIAAMQLYERGKLDLDSVEQVEEAMPEIKRINISI